MGIGKHLETLLAEADKNKDKEQFDKYQNELNETINKFKNYVLDQMKLNEKGARIQDNLHNIFQLLILLLTASLPLVNIIESSKIPTIIISVSDTILIGMINLFKFRDHALIKRQINQKLLQEYRWFSTGRGAYSNCSAGGCLDIFLDRTDEIQNESFQRYLTVEKLTQEHPTQMQQN